MKTFDNERERNCVRTVLIEPFKTKRSWLSKKQELQLSIRRDLCDQFAFGVFCLHRAIYDPLNRDITVKLEVGLCEPSKFQVHQDGRTYTLPKNAIYYELKQLREVIRYVFEYDKESTIPSVVAILLYSTFTAHVDDVFFDRHFYRIAKKYDNWRLNPIDMQNLAYAIIVDFHKRNFRLIDY